MTENQNLIKKYKPLTPEEVRAKIKEKEEAKTQYSVDSATLERELESFNEIIDPLINPVTGKAMCWVRRPTQAEWEGMVPANSTVYSKNPDEMTPEETQIANNALFDLMANVIANPKHDAKYWKEHSNLMFIQLFNMHLNGVFKELGVMTTNF
jgi:hypothetical protein